MTISGPGSCAPLLTQRVVLRVFNGLGMTGVEPMEEAGTTHFATREVVGFFISDSALESAVEQLQIAGVDRAAISVLGMGAQRPGRVESLFRSAKALADDPSLRQAAFVSHASRTEGEAMAIAFPAGIGGIAGAWAVAAAGGALVTGIGIIVLGGAVGAGLGTLLFHAVARHHAADVESQLARGGLILWVATPDEAAEQRVLEVLQRCGGGSVHTHTIDRAWGVADTPLHDVQPDPFLEHEKR